MIITIHQPQYMPWSGYLHKMASADLFVILDNVQFRKNEWQHRNRIRGPQGPQWLSVPNTYKYPQCINEVGIADDQRWQAKHLGSIEACYKKSRYFKEYFPRFEAFFNQKFDNLARCNIESVTLVKECLGITTPVEIASSITIDGTSTERLVNICRHFGADTYLAGAGGRNYMDMEQFDAAGIKVDIQEFHPPYYTQLWCKKHDDFIAGLSVIDMIFNCGPDTYTILMGEVQA